MCEYKHRGCRNSLQSGTPPSGKRLNHHKHVCYRFGHVVAGIMTGLKWKSPPLNTSRPCFHIDCPTTPVKTLSASTKVQSELPHLSHNPRSDCLLLLKFRVNFHICSITREVTLSLLLKFRVNFHTFPITREVTLSASTKVQSELPHLSHNPRSDFVRFY